MLRKWKESMGSEANYERLAQGLGHQAVERRELIDAYCRDRVAELAHERMAKLEVSLKDDNVVPQAETSKRVLPSVEILPGKPFHVTQRRGKEIQKIKDIYSELSKSAKVSTVTGIYMKGPPGCGKTQLARQFGKEFIEECESRGVKFPRIVATLHAQTPESLLESYKELHEKLEIPKEREIQGSVRDRIKSYVEDVKNYFRETSALWLLIVDNLTVNDPLREFWPTPEQDSPWGKGLVLVTTQDSELAPRSHAHAKVMPLDSGMEDTDAMGLLREISGLDVDEDAKKVAKLLGHYPLSLACAAVYVRQMREDRPFSKFSWKNYLTNLEEYFAYLDHSDYTHHNPCYPQSMLPAAEFAARRMAENNEVLRAAFVFLSYCSLQPVPLDTVADYVLREAKARGDAKIRVPDDIKVKVARCSLLIYPETGERGIEVVTLHQVMLLAFLQIRRKADVNKPGNEEKSAYVSTNNVDKQELNSVLQTLNEAYKQKKGELKQEDIATRILLCPHLKEFVDGVERVQWIESSLLVQALVYLADGLIHVAGATDNHRVALLERAYKINKQLCSTDVNACALLCDLGYTYREAGKLDKVIPILEEANKLCESQSDAEWMKQRSELLNILAFTFRECFQLDLAKEYMKLCVDVTKKAHGEKAVPVAERLCNLGVILHDRWENEEAIEVLEEARKIAETCDTSEMFIRGQVLNYTAKVHLRWYLGLRHTHPSVWSTKMHLKESDSLHEQALKIYHDLHGDQHKFTTGVMMTYGTAKLHLGEVDQAYDMCQRAVQVYRSSGHIAWPRASTHLADVLLARGDYVRAKEVLEELVQVHEDLNLTVSPGAFHHRALMAEVCAHLGDVETGRKILEECLEVWKGKNLHPEHYWVARARAFLEGLRSRETREESARGVYELPEELC